MIRNAAFVDVPGMILMLRDAHARSRYAGTATEVSDEAATALLTRALVGHGGKGEASSWVQVSEENGEIVGLMVGGLQRVMHVGTTLFATDLYWVMKGQAPARDGIALLRGFLTWAWSSPYVSEVQIATRLTGLSDPRVDKILERLGFETSGAVYRLERLATAAAA